MDTQSDSVNANSVALSRRDEVPGFSGERGRGEGLRHEVSLRVMKVSPSPGAARRPLLYPLLGARGEARTCG